MIAALVHLLSKMDKKVPRDNLMDRLGTKIDPLPALLCNPTFRQLIRVNYSCQFGGSFPCLLAFWYKESEMTGWQM